MIFLWYYIKQIKEEDLLPKKDMPNFMKKIIIKLRKLLKYGKIKKIDGEKMLYIFPKEKIQRRIKKNENNIILSKELKEKLKSNKRGIEINTKQIQKYLLEETIQYILEILEEKTLTLEMIDLYFLVNQYEKENVEILTYFLEKVKTMNIITKDVQNYIRLEEKWETEKGIFITVSNNKRKSLKKARWVINLDFEMNELKNYVLYRNAFILNMTEEKQMKIPAFEGIIIQKIELTVKEKLQQEWKAMGLDSQVFDIIDLYETCVQKQSDYFQNVRKLEENGVKIINLIGNNGRIGQKEILEKKIFLTN